MSRLKIMSNYFKIEGYVDCRISSRGPILYFLKDFDKDYDLYSIYWRVFQNNKIFLIDTGIKDIGYINSTVKSGGFWNRISEPILFDNIDFIFPTHFHYDHCSFVYDYKHSKIVLNYKAYKNLFNEKYQPIYSDKIYKKEIIENIRKKKNVILVDDSEEIINGVTTYWVGGHTPCSQSIIFNPYYEIPKNNGKKFVFAGDIISTFRNIKEKIPGGYNYCLIDYFEFFKRFSEKEYEIIPSHDVNAISLFNNIEIKV